MAPRLNVAKWRRRRGVRRLVEALGASEGLVRYVGGAVRDELLGLRVSDLDLATRLPPEEVMARLESVGIKVVPTGIDHGTVTAVSDGHPVEITTLRRDVSTDGRRASIAYTEDWREDAARRDFTINALSADPESGEIFDYFDGLPDLEQRRIRFIGDPLARIAEDHLRILRFFRFHARFGAGAPDPEALNACAERANDLMALSRERIADELLKLLGVPDPAPTIVLMIRNGILAPVLPEIAASSIERLRRVLAAEWKSEIAGEPLRRLAALLPADGETADRIGARLKLSKKARKRLACAVSLDPVAKPKALAYRVGTQCAVDRLLIAGRAEDARAIASWPVPRLPIGGGALIARGVSPGPEVARALRGIENLWLDQDFPDGEAFDRLVETVLASN